MSILTIYENIMFTSWVILQKATVNYQQPRTSEIPCIGNRKVSEDHLYTVEKILLSLTDHFETTEMEDIISNERGTVRKENQKAQAQNSSPHFPVRLWYSYSVMFHQFY